MMPHLGHTELTVDSKVAGVYMWALVKDKKRKTLQPSLLSLSDEYLHAIRFELTFAGLHAFEPRVINVSVASTPTVLKPSTTRSATTDSPGLPERATF